tara:strand:- start:37 stop:288 length:252 start_codon:yes stop_codon:yes gene_type:complete
MVMKKYKITTKLRDGIKDIEGETIEQKLRQDGWSIEDIKVGQVFYLQATNPHITDNFHYIEELCKKILVNTLLYDFEIEDVDE